MGVKIDNVNYADISRIINMTIKENRKGYICVNDVDNVIAASKNDMLREAINSSLLSIADGTPLAWFGKLAGCKEIERVAGMDLMMNLFSEMKGCRHYLLGDTESTIGGVIEKAGKMYRDIQIEGYSPPFKEFDEEDNRLMMDKITEAKPDIIWVGLGGGKQDKWMYNNIKSLDHGVMIGVGAAFRWFTGDLKTPPKLIQKMGLQWLFRTMHNFMEDPIKNFIPIMKRIFHRRVKFVLRFPGEVIRARRKIRNEG